MLFYRSFLEKGKNLQTYRKRENQRLTEKDRTRDFQKDIQKDIEIDKKKEN